MLRDSATDAARRYSLLEEFLIQYPFQPATAYWRAIEIDEVASGVVPLLGRVLDVGCGDGRLSRIVDEAWAGQRIWVGVDSDEAEIDAARSGKLYEGLYAASAASLPLDDSTFDAAFSNSVLEHIPQVEPVIAEVSRLLKMGGRFVFTVPSPGFHTALAGPWLPMVSRELYLDRIDKRLAHHHYLDEQQWSTALRRVGLTLTMAKPYLQVAHVRTWENLSRVTGGLLHALTGHRVHPLVIQRKLKMRTGSEKLPSALSKLIARALRSRLADRKGETQHSCWLIEATKTDPA
jgi:SAM-dependent methyltransferase